MAYAFIELRLARQMPVPTSPRTPLEAHEVPSPRTPLEAHEVPSPTSEAFGSLDGSLEVVSGRSLPPPPSPEEIRRRH